MGAREVAPRAEREEGTEGTPQASMLQQDGGPIGGVCRLRMDILLALVEYSNEGGPGPSYNMQEVPGSTLIMRAVHVYPEPVS